MLIADSAPEGVDEDIAPFPMLAPTYYLRVREDLRPGHYPTENVSDTYSIRFDWVTPGHDDEREVNDSLDLANEIDDRNREFTDVPIFVL